MKLVAAILIVAVVASVAFFVVSRRDVPLDAARPGLATPDAGGEESRDLSARGASRTRANASDPEPDQGADLEGGPVEEDEIEARRTILFHVLERSTEAELDGVELLVHQGEDTGCMMLPTPGADARALARGVDSPVTVVPEPRPATYWAVAEGYAWGYLEVVDPEHRPEYEIKLAPACGLVVTVQNHDPTWGVKLLVQRSPGSLPGTRAVVDVPMNGVVRLDLEEGVYTVAGFQGEWSNRIQLGIVTTELSPGRVAEVSLVLDEPPMDSDRVALSGELILSEGTPLPRVSLTILPADHELSLKQPRQRLLADEMVPSSEDGGRLLWNGEPVLPGTYVARVDLFGIRQEFAVGASGGFVSVALPELHEVRVSVAVEGPDLELPSLDGTVKTQRLDYTQSTLPEEGSNVYVFRVPAGPMRLGLRHWEWVDPATTYDVPSCGPEIGLTLRRSSRVEISLYDGGTPQVMNRGWLGRIRARSQDLVVDEPPTISGKPAESTLLRFQSTGVLDLHFAVVPGFRPIPPAEVELLPGETRRVRIQLER